MILVDAPMALLANLRRDQPPVHPDDETIGRLRAAVAELDPDPLFRRRLRGTLLNGYVEVREGMRPAPPSTGMGRIGRAVLYASLAIAMGATAVGAASQAALPGDPLYGAKIAIEQLRWDLAPASVRLQLAAASLDERIDELEQLAAKGNWALAAASVQQVAAELQRLQEMGGGAPSADETRIEHRLTVLTAVFEKAPPAAKEGLQRAIAAPEGVPGQQPSVGSDAIHSPVAAPTPSPRPERTAKSERTPHPTPSGH
jgi:hypothetical protein